MTSPSLYLWIAVGSGLGGMARFALSTVVTRNVADAFPWGTLLVNILGSLVIGFIATLTEPGGHLPGSLLWRHFLMTGVLGGFTTFSAFSLQTLVLAREGDWLRAGANVVGSVVLCLVAVWLGHLLASQLNAAR